MGILAATKKALNKIESAMARAGFALGDTLDGALPLVLSSDAGSGGAAQEVMTVTGLKTTDTILAVSQRISPPARRATDYDQSSISAPAHLRYFGTTTEVVN